LDPIRFFKKILPAQLVGFSTQSSAGTLPLTTSILTERVGVGASVANFTASLGTTIGMPGCSGIWPVLVAVWGINGLGLNFGPSDYVRLALISLVVSLGTAGVPGTATIVTAGVLTAVGLPLEILVLVIPISAIADTGRTATNITAAMVSSAIVARQEGVLDDAVFNDEREYDPGVVPADPEGDVDSAPSGVPEAIPSARPSGIPASRVPVGDPAYALLEAEIGVGEACPF
jgi:L-cystine uptake protein TcyP (sodium:dicarboxylate symporter family)